MSGTVPARLARVTMQDVRHAAVILCAVLSISACKLGFVGKHTAVNLKKAVGIVVTGPGVSEASVCTGPFTVQGISDNGESPATLDPGTSFTIFGPSTAEIFTNDTCVTAASGGEVVPAAGTDTAQFYLKLLRAASLTLSATSSALTPGTLALSVLAGVPTQLKIVAPSSIGQFQCRELRAQLVDAGGVKTAARSDLNVRFFALALDQKSGVFIYPNGACQTPITEKALATGQSDLSVFILAPTAGDISVTFDPRTTGIEEGTAIVSVLSGSSPRLSITGPPGNITAGTCSALSARSLTSDGSELTVRTDVPVALVVTGSSGLFYSDITCTSTLNNNTAVIPAFAKSGTFFFKATEVAPSFQIAGSTSGFISGEYSSKIIAAPPASIAMVNGSVNILAGECRGPVNLTLKDTFSNIAIAPAATISLSADGTSGGVTQFFAPNDITCVTPVSSVTVDATTMSTASFYFRVRDPGASVLKAFAAGLVDGTSTVTINNARGTPDKLVLTPARSSPQAGDCLAVTLSSQDAFGNPKEVAVDLNITLSPLGSGSGFFSDATCVIPVSNSTISKGNFQKDLFFRGTLKTTGPTVVGSATDSTSPLNANLTLTIQNASPSELRFSGVPAQIVKSSCSGAVTIESFDTFGNAAAVSVNTALSLQATNGGQFFGDDSCIGAITSVTIAAGTNRTNSTPGVYFKGTAVGLTNLVGVGPNPIVAANKTVDVLAPPATKLALEFSTPVIAGTCREFQVKSVDSLTNATALFDSITVTVSSTSNSPELFFTNPTCSQPSNPTTIVISSAGANPTFLFFMDTKAESITVSANALSGPAPVSIPIQVVPAAPLELKFDPAGTATIIKEICTGPFKIDVLDRFANRSGVATDTTVIFTTTGSTIGVFADNSCTQSSIILPVAESRASLYIRSGTPGTGTVTASATGLSVDARSWKVINPSAQVTMITPNQGSPLGGARITLGGSQFISGVTVSIGANECTGLTFESPNRVSCTTPAGSAGFADVVVTNPEEALAATITNGFQYINSPIVASVSPVSGKAAGGTAITINGANFWAGSKVAVGPNACSAVVVVNATQITCTTPEGEVGPAAITITDSNNFSGSLGNAFRYFGPPTLTTLRPSNGLETGGTVILITGNSFEAGAEIRLGGVLCTTPTITGTLLSCTTGPHEPGPVDVMVKNPDGQFGTLTGAFSYLGKPTIMTVSPASGPTTGGTAINLDGTHFDSQTIVQVGSSGCGNIRNLSDTFLTCDTPSNAAVGAVPVAVTNRTLVVFTKDNGFEYTHPPPMVTRIVPNTSGSPGNARIEIDGNYFRTGVTVTIGGNPCKSLNLQSANRLDCVVAPHTPGSVDVIVANAVSGVATVTNGFTFLSAPTLTAINPASGPTTGTTNLVIAGTDFVTGAAVKLDTLDCGFVNVISSFEIRCVTPMHAAGAVNVSVTNTDGGTANRASGFLYIAPPTVTAVSPIRGPAGGGIPLTITGTNLTTGLTVTVGGVGCAPVTVGSPTQATCTLPAVSPGVVAIVVTNLDGQSATLSGEFTVDPAPTITSVDPLKIPASGGATLIINGTQFVSGVTVLVGGTNCPLIAPFSVTQIRCTTPVLTALQTTTSVDVAARNPDGQTATLAGAVIVDPRPTLTSIDPTHGPASGQTNITLTGTNFAAGATVKFGTLFATNVAVPSGNQITCRSPAGMPSGSKEIVVTNPDGQNATLPGGYLVDAPPIVSLVNPARGPASGGIPITVTGQSFVQGARLFFGTTECPGVTFSSFTSLACTLPALLPGVVDIRVQNPDGQTSTLAAAFTIDPPPLITTLVPTNGPATISLRLTVNGTNFVSGATVKLRGTACAPVTRVSGGQLTCPTPLIEAGPADVLVTNPDGQSATLANGFLVNAAPTITSITPANGRSTGTSGVTIVGTRLDPLALVDFGGSVCTNVVVSGGTQLTCLTSAHAPGAVIVTITNPDGQRALRANGYVYDRPPVLLTVSPQNGSSAGGTAITLTGTDFVTGAGILVGDLNCNAISISPPTGATCSTPAHVSGSVDVKFINPDTQSSTLSQGFTFNPAPRINTVSPNHGPASGGNSITVGGLNFVNGSQIKLDGVQCQTAFIDSASISCPAPAHAAGTVSVNVTNPDAQFFTLASGYTYDPAPTIATVSPLSGPAAGGTQLTITGTRFLAGMIVDIGGSSCGSVAINTGATQLTCTTTQHASGLANVKVTNTDTQFADKSLAFEFIAAPSVVSVAPGRGPESGGTNIIIAGQNFSAGARVQVGGVDCVSPIVTSNQISCSTPLHAPGSVPVRVTNPDLQFSQLLNAFNFDARPIIASVSPNYGPSTGVTGVLITGSNFVNGVTVTIGGNSCAGVSFVSSSQVACSAQSHEAGLADVKVRNPDNQEGILTNGFNYAAPPVLLSVDKTSGPDAGGTALVITGIGFVDGAVTRVGGQLCTGGTVFQSPNQLSCNTPAYTGSSSRTVSLSVTNPDNQAAALVNVFSYVPAPEVVELSPTNGPASGGALLSVRGRNFTGAASVKIGTSVCPSPNLASASEIKCTIPPKTCGLYPVIVTNGDLQVSNGSVNYTFNCPPLLTGIVPPYGPKTRAVNVVMNGSNFKVGATATLGTGICSSVALISSTQLGCTTPINVATGAVTARVTNPDGQFSELIGGYTFDAPPTFIDVTPATVPATLPSTLTIRGSGFITGAGLIVTVNRSGLASPISCGSAIVSAVNGVAGEQIQCRFPGATSGTYEIKIQNPDLQIVTSSATALTVVAAPTLSEIRPQRGPRTGATGVTLTGTGFVSGAGGGVSIGSSACTAVNVASSTEITCTTSASNAGTFDVVVINPDQQTARLTNGFIYDPPPAIRIISPIIGRASGGTSVTIEGTGFRTGVTANFGGAACNPVGTIGGAVFTCETTPHAAGITTLTVTNADGLGTSLANAFTFLAPPLVRLVNPTHGPSDRTTRIEISGDDFQGGAIATVGGFNCGNLTFSSGSLISCDVPSRAPGPVAVVVVNPDFQSSTLVNGFTYDAPPTVERISPIHGPATGGTRLEITGLGFVAPVTVDVGGTNCGSVAVVSSSTVNCTTTAHSPGLAYVRVVNLDGQSGQLSNAFTFDAPPTFTSISPTFGPVQIPKAVTVAGTHFASGLSARFDSTNCTNVRDITATSFTCDTPANFTPTGLADLTIINSDLQTVTRTNAYTFIPPPTIISVSPAVGPITGNTFLTINGENFTTIAGVMVDNSPCINPVVTGSTKVECMTGAHAAGTLAVVVTNSDLQTAVAQNAFTYRGPPIVTDVIPMNGPATGGYSVTVAGSGFQTGNVTIQLGSVACAPVSVILAGATLRCTAGSSLAGTVSVRVTNPDLQFGVASNAFTYNAPNAPPELIAVIPSSGPTAGNVAVVLEGNNFGAAAIARFNGVVCPSQRVVSARRIECIIPASLAVTVSVQVANSDGQVSQSGSFTYDTNAYNGIDCALERQNTNTQWCSGTGLDGGSILTGVSLAALKQLCDSSPYKTGRCCLANYSNGITTWYLYSGLPGAPSPIYNVGDQYTMGICTSVRTDAVPTENTYLYRGYRQPIDDHLYSLSSVEVGSNGYVSEGEAFRVFTQQYQGTAPVYRLYLASSGIHYYTLSASERDGLVSQGWKYEKTEGYLYSANPTGRSEVFHIFFPVTGGHLFTTSASEKSAALGAGGQSQTSLGFTLGRQPRLDSVTPNFLALTGGQTVTLGGANFTTGSTVALAGQPCAVTSISPTQIICTAGASPVAITGDAVITIGDLQTATRAGTILYYALTIDTVSPASGALTGGTTINIAGAGFSSPTVKIDGETLACSAIASSVITCTAAPIGKSLGAKDVVITNSDLASVTKTGGFTYTAPTGNFHTAFVTSERYSGNIPGLAGADFRCIARARAGGLTGNWRAILSDSLTDAKVRLAISGPVFTIDSRLVAKNSNDLWDGTIVSPIDRTEFNASPGANNIVWTGTQSSGLRDSTSLSQTCGDWKLAAFENAEAGSTAAANSTWISINGNAAGGNTQCFNSLPIYCISQPLAAAPTLTMVTPTNGPATIAIPITIAGLNLEYGSTITIRRPSGDTPCDNPTYVAPTAYTCTTPVGQAAGPVSLVYQDANGRTSTLNSGYTFIAAPTITQVTPPSGPVTGGTQVTVTGTGFQSPIRGLTIGDQLCTSPIVVNSTSITCTTGARNGPGLSSVIISNADGQSGTGLNLFTYLPPVPTLTSVSPASGVAAGGTTLTFTGTNFLSGSTLTIIGDTLTKPCTSPTFVSSTQYTCVTPSMPAGAVRLTYEDTYNRQATLVGKYLYSVTPSISGFTPASGSASGGTVLTINGTFNSVISAALEMGNTSAPCSLGTFSPGPVLPTSFTCTTGAVATVGAYQLKVVDLGVTLTAPTAFTYTRPPPSLTTIAPTSGATGGDTLVTINGGNFRSGVSAVIGGVQCIATGTVNPTSFSCTTGTHASGIVSVVVTNTDDGGSTTLPNSYSYNLPANPIVTAISPTTGPGAGGTAVTISGDGFESTNSVVIGDNNCSGVNVQSPTRLTCTTGASRDGLWNVTVIRNTGAQGFGSNLFRYTTQPNILSTTPASGGDGGGTLLSITGNGFGYPVEVRVGGITCANPTSPNLAASQTVQCTTGAKSGGGSFPVVLNNPSGLSSSASSFNYVSGPTISAVNPASGAVNVATNITITGTGFSSPLVDVGTQRCTNVGPPTATQIQCTVPGGLATGPMDVVVANTGTNNYMKTLAGGFTYTLPTGDYHRVFTTRSTYTGNLEGLVGADAKCNSEAAFVGLTGYWKAIISDFNTHASSRLNILGHIFTMDYRRVAISKTDLFDGSISTPINRDQGNVATTPSNILIWTATNGNGLKDAASTADTCNNWTSTVGGVESGRNDENGINWIAIYSTMVGGANSCSNQGALYCVSQPTPGAPTVSLVSPTGGPISGNTTIGIVGTTLDGAAIKLGTAASGYANCTAMMQISSTNWVCKTPLRSTAGLVDVVLTTGGGSATKSGAFTYTSPAANGIQCLVPVWNAPATSCTGTVIASGSMSNSDLPSAAQLACNATNNINGSCCMFHLYGVGKWFLTDGLPQSTSRLCEVVSGSQNDCLSGGTCQPVAGILAASVATVTAVTPATGPVAGGTQLTITGSNFVYAKSIDLDGMACTTPVFSGDTSATCTTTARTAGAVKLNVVGPAGTGSLNNAFTYGGPGITSIYPTTADNSGGTKVDVIGSGFVNGATIFFGATQCPNSMFISSNALRCHAVPTLTGATAATVNIKVQNPDGTNATLANGFRYIDTPFILAVSPAAGPVSGGMTVYIDGANMGTPGTTITIGGVPCAPLSLGETRSVCYYIPPRSTAGYVDVVVRAPSGASYTFVNGFRYELNSPTNQSCVSFTQNSISCGDPNNYEWSALWAPQPSGLSLINGGGSFSATTHLATRLADANWGRCNRAPAPILATYHTYPATIVNGGVTYRPTTNGNMGSLECPAYFSTFYSPLIVDLKNEGISLTAPNEGVVFDILGEGFRNQISWPKNSANSMFLVLDRDKNGQIDSVHELFGNNTVGPDGKKAANGFEALAKYDTNQDYVIDYRDSIYNDLRLWSDGDRNAKVKKGELKTLASMEIKIVDLAYTNIHERNDFYGNESLQRSVVMLDNQELRRIYDVWFVPGIRQDEPTLAELEILESIRDREEKGGLAVIPKDKIKAMAPLDNDSGRAPAGEIDLRAKAELLRRPIFQNNLDVAVAARSGAKAPIYLAADTPTVMQSQPPAEIGEPAKGGAPVTEAFEKVFRESRRFKVGWVVLGLVVLAGGVTLLIRRSRRRR